MPAVNLTVEVHCVDSVDQANYRLYNNNDLLTERTWIWDLNTLISENIWVDIPNNSTNTVRIELVTQNNSIAQIALRNLQVVDCLYTSEQINDQAISFTLQ
jgi:hypothetical protein